MAAVINESGLTFGDVKDVLRRVAANGVCGDDERVMTWTNEATLELLNARDPASGITIIPVGCMSTYYVKADGTSLLLPKEIKNAIEVEVIRDPGFTPGPQRAVNGQYDVVEGWYDLVNPFTYVDPNIQHDNPLVDLGLSPDPTSRSIRRRLYDFPGLEPNATVRVTGVRAFVPITADTDYLTIQNVPALKLMMIAINHRENNDPEGGKNYKTMAVDLLIDEIKSFMLDPRQSLKRKAAYDADMANLPMESFGYFRARLAYDLPAGLQRGKSELTRLLEQAEQRLMARGHPVGTLEEFSATVEHGRILAPDRVKSIVAADLCGQPLDIRNIFFQYLKNGPGRNGCSEMLIDEGEHYDAKKRKRYRQYRLGGEHDMRQYYSTTQTAVSTPPSTGATGEPGTTGSRGPGLRFGNGAPSDSLGADDDSYVDLDTYDLYLKTNGTYALIGNIRGPAGADALDALTLNLEGLEGGGSTMLDGVDVDALNIGLNDARMVIIDGIGAFYQVVEGAPAVDQVAVLNHADWHWQKTL